MKNALRIGSLSAVIILCFVTIHSCGKDEAKEKPFQKFIGEYDGEFSCNGVLAVLNTNNAAFSITPPADPKEENKVTVTVNIVGAGVFPFDATVSGNNLTFSELNLKGYTVTLPVVGAVSADLTITGSASISGERLDGQLNMIVDAGITKLTDQCKIVGTKK